MQSFLRVCPGWNMDDHNKDHPDREKRYSRILEMKVRDKTKKVMVSHGACEPCADHMIKSAEELQKDVTKKNVR